MTRGKMTTAADRLHFAVAFAEANLDHHRESDWMRLREDLEGFLYGSAGQPMPAFGGLTIQAMAPPFPAEYPKDRFRELQAEVRGLLYGIAPSPGVDVNGGPGFTLSQTWNPVRIGQHVMLAASSSVRDGFLFLLVLLLAQHGLQNVRRCAAQDCGRLFWRTRRDQLYDSRTCVNRVNMRAWVRKQRKKKGRARPTGRRKGTKR